jgi:hypothetical protein
LTQLTTYWSKARDYHTVELEFDGDKIVFKDWWDHGHDPNRTGPRCPLTSFSPGHSTMRSGRNWVRLCTTKLSSLFSY